MVEQTSTKEAAATAKASRAAKKAEKAEADAVKAAEKQRKRREKEQKELERTELRAERARIRESAEAAKAKRKLETKVWDEWEVKRLLALRKQKIPFFANINQGTAEQRWTQFSQELANPETRDEDGCRPEPVIATAAQCKAKWNNLQYAYKKYTEARRDGALLTFPYVDELSGILSEAADVKPIQGSRSGRNDRGLTSAGNVFDDIDATPEEGDRASVVSSNAQDDLSVAAPSDARVDRFTTTASMSSDLLDSQSLSVSPIRNLAERRPARRAQRQSDVLLVLERFLEGQAERDAAAEAREARREIRREPRLAEEREAQSQRLVAAKAREIRREQRLAEEREERREAREEDRQRREEDRQRREEAAFERQAETAARNRRDQYILLLLALMLQRQP